MDRTTLHGEFGGFLLEKDKRNSENKREDWLSGTEIEERLRELREMNIGVPSAKIQQAGKDALINLCKSYYNNKPPIKVTDSYLLELGKVFSGEEIIMMLGRKVLTL